MDQPNCFQYDILGKRVSFYLPDPRDHIQKHIITQRNFYENEMLTEISPLVPDGGLVVDIGANIGNHTIFFAKLLGVKVVSVEPTPPTLDILRRNVELNKLEHLVEIKGVALGSSKAKGSIVNAASENTGMAQVLLDEQGAIDVLTLDDIIDDRFVHMMKIDVEGMEVDVLLGAMATIRRCKPNLIIEASTIDALKKIEAILQPLGYMKVMVFNHTPTYLFKPVASVSEHRAIERIPAHVCAQLPETHSIHAGMATVRGNEIALRAAIASILPQVDHLHLYLNGFDEAPSFVANNPRISYHIDRDGTEYGDAGKFWGLEKLDKAIYFTCDDDIIYPSDYVERLVSELAMSAGKGIATAHATIMMSPNTGYYKLGSRIVLHFRQALLRRRRVHIGGTGTCAFHSDTVRMTLKDFGAPNMADVWLAQYANANNIPIYAVARAANWMKPLQVARKNIYDESSRCSGSEFDSSTAQDKILQAMSPISIIKSDAGLRPYLLEIEETSDIPLILSQVNFEDRDPVVFVIGKNMTEELKESIVKTGVSCEIHLLDREKEISETYVSLLKHAFSHDRVFKFGSDKTPQRYRANDFDTWLATALRH